jgi:hypothetical protein
MQARKSIKNPNKEQGIFNVKSISFLDIVIDSSLSWEVHVERTYSRISCKLFLINRLSKCLISMQEECCIMV